MLFKNHLLLRIAIAVILLMHSITSLFSQGIFEFGQYLDTTGFKRFGIVLAWAIKLSHVGAAICLLINKYVRIAGFVTIFILLMGIIMVHYPNGWYVVGGGSNGIEFNVLLICTLLTVMYAK